MILSLVVVGLIILAATVVSLVYFLDKDEPLPDAPTLEFQSRFPVGYDRHHLDLKAVGYDGQSRCSNIWKGQSLQNQPWTSKGIRYTKTPDAQAMEAAQPLLNNAYSFIGDTPDPHRVGSLQVPIIRPASNCEVKYEAALWQTEAVAANNEPIPLLDGLDRPYHYAATEVRLGGDGDGQGGTRFLLEGPGNATGVRLGVSLFRPGEFNTEGRVYHNVSAEPLDLAGRFAFVFDVPALGLSEGKLVMMPLDLAGNVPDAVLNRTVSFDRLMRLQTTDVQIYIGMTAAPAQPIADDTIPVGGIRAPSLAEADRMVRERALSEDLGAIGNAMFLVQQAFEPRAAVTDARLVQTPVIGSSTTSTVLELTGDGVARKTHATYRLVVTDARTTFTVSVRDSPLAAKAASQAWEATAILSRISADGAAIVESASGDTVDAAVTALHRSVSIAGHQRSLDAVVGGGRDLLRQANHAFLAAAVIASGWEFYKAEQAERPLERLEHRLEAGRIIVEGVFSMTLPGALVVAASHLVVHVLTTYAAPGLVEDLAMSLQSSSGEMSARGAHVAWMKAAPQIQEYAEVHGASFLEQHVHETDSPQMVLASLVVLGFIAVGILFLFSRR